MPLHTRLEVRDLIGVDGMLEVIQSPAISNGRNQCPKLQWGHGDAFAKGAHFANATEFGRNLGVRIRAQLLAGDVISGKFPESELMGVIADFFETELAAKRLEVGIIRMR